MMMDVSRSRTIQVATPVVGTKGISYNVSTIDLGTDTREKKVEQLQEFIATVVHLIQQDNFSKEELKAQVANLTVYIQQWYSTKEMPTTSTNPPQLLSKEKIDKMEKRKNLEKTTKTWFQQVQYVGNMGIGRAVRTTKKFFDLQQSLEGMKKLCTDFLARYESTYQKIEAILKLPSATWEKELAFKRDDH